MALHFYDTDPQKLISYVEHWHQKYGKDVVVTEFACQVRVFLVTAPFCQLIYWTELRGRRSSLYGRSLVVL